MKTSFQAAFLALLFHAHLTIAKDCSNSIGQEECVSYFRGSDCQGAAELGSFTPTCAGNCFQFSSFDSVGVVGNDLFGTDCHIFSDPNCQNQIADSGNHVSSGRQCVNAQGAQSMQCFFNC
ncbi:hypothetical protein B0H19DRAFT_963463 [Mycena capillaripes]|nr:hypothetical protein B0H19DRAFT_963463 [Mycena capillaripes]